MRYSGLKLVLTLLLMVFVLTPMIGQASDFPDRPVTLVIPYPAGGATDVVMRPLCDAVKQSFGQPVVIENRPGAGSIVGLGSIVGKKPDGYLISTVIPVALFRNAHMTKLPFDAKKDFTPIMMLFQYLNGIAVRADSPFKTLHDVVKYAKTNPNKLTYMASGVGSTGFILMEELCHVAGGIKLNHIPSKGDPESIAKLLGGHTDMIATNSGWAPQVLAGKLRLLGIWAEKRYETFPEVPTVAELGYTGPHYVASPCGIVGPAGMPKEIVKRIHDGFKNHLDDQKFQAALKATLMPVTYMGVEESGKYWEKAYEEAGRQVRLYIK
jgi:tripartite-type tricarboxylate transporter receptor subunit TctC